VAVQLGLRLDLSGPPYEVMTVVESLTGVGLVVDGSSTSGSALSVQLVTAEPTTLSHLAAIAAAVAAQA